jgi:hypothetical protein
MSDEWADATFVGAQRSQRRRVADWSPQERLAWLEAAVVELAGQGLLAPLRERKQRDLIKAWNRPS